MRQRIHRVFVYLVVLVVGALVSVPAGADGGSVYSAQCAQCHGQDGGADTPVGKAMKATVLSGETWSMQQLTAAIREGARHKAVSAKVSDEDLATVAEFLPTLGGGS